MPRLSDDDLARLRSVRQGGRTDGTARVRDLVDGSTGRVTCHEVDYADGRQAAVVRPDTVRQSVSIGGTR